MTAGAPTIAVTGAGGYVGGRLVGALDVGAVRALVRHHRPWLPAGVAQREVDLLGPVGPIANALGGIATVVHLAGHSEVVAAAEPERAMTETVLAAQRVGEAATAAGVGRIVYVSTVHVYGRRTEPGAVLTEDLQPEPTSTYAEARRSCEQLLAGIDGPDLVVLRLSNAVGSPADVSVDRWTLVANDLCRQAVTTGRLVLRTSGSQWRDFVAMDDVVAAIAAATEEGRVAAGTYNLALGRSHRVRDLAGMVADSAARRTGRRPVLEAPDVEASPPGPHTVAVDRLRRQGIDPATPPESAVDETVRFCLEHRDRW